jgi:plastocyanin
MITITSSLLFALTIKIIGLTAIAAIIFSANVVGIQNSYAQIQASQEQEPQEGEEQQVESSDGELTVRLNGDSFTTGDTITISGTVQQREPDSYVAIEVVDPESNTVEKEFPDVTADNTFNHSFIAGEQKEFDVDEPMEISGNYRIVARYFPPGDEAETEEVELVFEYTATRDDIAESETAAGPTTIFQSTEDRIRLQVPNGWVIEDAYSTDPLVQQYMEQYGVEYLAFICPENQALPEIGGAHTCTATSPGDVTIAAFRFVDLSSRPELAVLARENRSVITSDLLALYIEHLRKTESPELLQGLRIVEDTDVTVNMIDSQTNQTIAKAPAKNVELSHAQPFGTGNFSEYALFVLHNDTGYVVRPIFFPGIESDADEPSFVTQVLEVLDSFQLVISPMNTTAASTTVSKPQNNATTTNAPFSPNSTTSADPNTATTSLPLQDEPQQKQPQIQQQNSGNSISIVSGSSSLTTDAYQPNPIQVSAGATVTWTNSDSQPHTATSGENATPDEVFDSGILAPAATFEHTFTAAGEYPYFCLVHPHMVGTVSVS